MKKAVVSLVRLEDYESNNVSRALEKCLGLLGGPGNILKPRSKVFVKINHLSPPSLPEKAIVTHPAFTREILRILKDFHMEITVGDDIQADGVDGFVVSTYRKVCDEMGVRLVNLKETGFRKIERQGKRLREFYISPLALDADCVINLPKLKTHAYTVFTGAIKNMFGVIPYGLRLQYHRDFQKNETFSEMLVDIFACAPPRLTVMDAVVAMEGEGPAGGNPREVGVVLASEDAVALDAVASKIAGFNPQDIFTTQDAYERGLGVGKLEEIDVVGESLSAVEVRNFKHSAIAVGFLRRKLPASAYAVFQAQLVRIPEVRQHVCTNCLECYKICPVSAIQKNKDSVWINKEKCIHCMCCHEVCHYQAIRLNQKFSGRVIRGLMALYSAGARLFG